MTCEIQTYYWPKKPRLLLSLIAFFCVFNCTTLFAQADQIKVSTSDKKVSTFLESHSGASIFVTALKYSSLWEKLVESAELMVFVPLNQALRAEGSAFLLEVVLTKPENKDRLNNVIAIHAYTNVIPIDTAIDSQFVIQSSNDDCLTIASKDGMLKVGPEAHVTDIVKAVDGTILFVDSLLWVPYMAGKNNCS